MPNTTILHLSDIHTGTGELRDEDLKIKLPAAERAKSLDRLSEYITDFEVEADYVVISGDVTIRGDSDGLRNFRDWLTKQIADKILPPAERVLLVPGNHDVRWPCSDGSDADVSPYLEFHSQFGKGFPTPFIPELNPIPGKRWLTRKELGKSYVGGTKIVKSTKEEATSYPFVLDNDRDLLIFLFNSTLGCGIFLEDPSSIFNDLEAISGILENSEKTISARVAKIAATYRRSLRIDAGMVGTAQLNYFKWAMKKLRQLLKGRFDRLTKIAVLHHHVSHLWRQQIEVKRFESVVDASQLKQYLHEFGFDMILHGHKHMNHVAMDTSMIPIGPPSHINPICIVSGGTVGGNPRLNDRQSFKIVELQGSTGPRTSATVEQVALVDLASPSDHPEIRDVYPISLVARLAEIQDMPDLKTAFDQFLLKNCKLLSESELEKLEPSTIDHDPAHPEIVGGPASYTFSGIVEQASGPKKRRYFDVLLADRRLGFRQRARIFWILADIGSASADATSELNLIVGNLEDTSLFRGESHGEVAGSIEELEKVFAPALESGALRIVEHVFTQEEVSGLLE
ncbi:metallophosphoesterase family protein [Candidatus Bipolaricaulota bacterium]